MGCFLIIGKPLPKQKSRDRIIMSLKIRINIKKIIKFHKLKFTKDLNLMDEK